jgi:hypothetical protein
LCSKDRNLLFDDVAEDLIRARQMKEAPHQVRRGRLCCGAVVWGRSSCP